MQDRNLTGRRWVYDRPLLRDPMFLLAVALGLAKAVGVVLDRDRYGTGGVVLSALLAVPYAVFGVGIVGGMIREFLRGRRGRS